jgi:hypothetical protein
MPPECEMGYKGQHCPTKKYTVFNKTRCEYKTSCQNHLVIAFEDGCTYVVYRARDYSVHGGHDLPKQ